MRELSQFIRSCLLPATPRALLNISPCNHGYLVAQLYEDNPGALSRDYALLQPSHQTTTEDQAAAAPSALEETAPADSKQLQDQGSSTAAPAEDTHETVAAEARDAYEVGEGSVAASKPAPTAVESHLSRLDEGTQSVGAAPQPSGDTTGRDASAPTSDELPIRRLHFASDRPDAASRTSSASTSVQQAPATGSGGSGAGEESSSIEHSPHADASAAAKPQQRGRRLWGVWSLFRRGRHADGERTAPSGVAGSTETNALLQPIDSSATASAAQLPAGTSSEVAHAKEAIGSGRNMLPGTDQPGTAIVHSAEPAAGWLPKLPVSNAATNV